MSYFPDVNIWIAIAAAGHLHHRTAKEWFDSIDDPILFSRVTQMGFLRLLTNPKVMGGEVLSPDHAWVLAERFLSDDRITMTAEPSGLQAAWRLLTAKQKTGVSFWTDSYLAAFATTAGLNLVTFDRDFRRFPGLSLTLLKND
jgi:toxin-antitoxin system PIN domain toxin